MEYFGLHGRAAFPRMLLHYMGVTKYENIGLSFEDFGAKKAAGEMGYWGGMPMVTLPDGTKLQQTHGLVRYLAAVY